MRNMTRAEWKDLQVALLAVPLRCRTASWKKAMDFVEAVAAGKNALAPEIDVENVRWVPGCVLCGNPIRIDQDYVFSALTSTYKHYDCHYQEPYREPGS